MFAFILFSGCSIGFGTPVDAVDAVVFVIDVLTELLLDFSRRREHFFSSVRDALLSAVFLSSSSSTLQTTNLSAVVCVPVLKASIRLINKLVTKHCSGIGFIRFDSYGVRLDAQSDLDVAFITQQWAIR